MAPFYPVARPGLFRPEVQSCNGGLVEGQGKLRETPALELRGIAIARCVAIAIESAAVPGIR
jgi:hypothetical protein